MCMVDKIMDTVTGSEFLKRRRAWKATREVPAHAFDEVGETNGRINKKYVLCEGSYLEEMYHDITSNFNNGYITCIDEDFVDADFTLDEFRKKKISCIMKLSEFKSYNRRYKESEAERATSAELICSRLANLFNVTTEYVAPIHDNPYGSILIDFLSGDEELMDFEEFTGTRPTVYAEGSNIGKWIEPLVNTIIKKSPVKGQNLMARVVRPMVRDFVKQYMFKKYIVHDNDLCFANIGVVHNADNTLLRMSPLYDYEKCFLPGIRSSQGQGLEDDLDYLVEHWPGLLKGVINDFTLTDEKKQQMVDIVKRFEPSAVKANEFCNLIENSTINFVGNAYMAYARQGLDVDEILAEKTMGF